ncbi:MAG: hypothetical protein AVDCRST_MAG50-2940, partial [uncultured Acidimicrobiales bacterium]
AQAHRPRLEATRGLGGRRSGRQRWTCDAGAAGSGSHRHRTRLWDSGHRVRMGGHGLRADEGRGRAGWACGVRRCRGRRAQCRRCVALRPATSDSPL